MCQVAVQRTVIHLHCGSGLHLSVAMPGQVWSICALQIYRAMQGLGSLKQTVNMLASHPTRYLMVVCSEA